MLCANCCYFCQVRANALLWAAYNGQLPMVEFLLGRGIDLETKDNVHLHFSYVACFLLFNSSVARAIRAFSLLHQASTY
jgi:ankyrin repeat protein